MRVVVLHNAVPADAPPEDLDTLVQVRTVVESLTRLGHEPMTVACTLDLAAMQEKIVAAQPDIVFNLVESLADADSLLYLPLAVLDALGIPYVGASTESLFLTANKLLGKQRMRAAGLPTPPWLETGPCSPMFSVADANSSRTWILKGVWDQGSRGMDDNAVLLNVEPRLAAERLAERAARLGRPCFAERYIEGREFNVAVLAETSGPQVLSPAEIEFVAFPAGKPHIVGHRAKWHADSFECAHTRRRWEFPASENGLLEHLRDLARACWEAFGLRGWARVDFRVDRDGRPWILEVNANPCLSLDAGFAAALEHAAISFDSAIARILADGHRCSSCCVGRR